MPDAEKIYFIIKFVNENQTRVKEIVEINLQEKIADIYDKINEIEDENEKISFLSQQIDDLLKNMSESQIINFLNDNESILKKEECCGENNFDYKYNEKELFSIKLNSNDQSKISEMENRIYDQNGNIIERTVKNFKNGSPEMKFSIQRKQLANFLLEKQKIKPKEGELSGNEKIIINSLKNKKNDKGKWKKGPIIFFGAKNNILDKLNNNLNSLQQIFYFNNKIGDYIAIDLTDEIKKQISEKQTPIILDKRYQLILKNDNYVAEEKKSTLPKRKYE